MAQQLCLHCGEPVKASLGKNVVNAEGKLLYVNPDQQVYFHGKCRTEARRLMRKNKVTLPFVGKVRKWLKTKNKYGQVVYEPFTMPSN